METPDKEIILVKKYIISEIYYKDGTYAMKRTCDGFDALELLGVLELTQREIVDQIRGRIKPDIIERKFINRK